MTTNTTTTRIKSFAVSVNNVAIFRSSPGTYTHALKRAAEMRARGLEAEVVAEMSGLPGTIDVEGAILYDGATWLHDSDGYLYPAVVNGITYREVAA